jgi:hypothetical protein
VHIGAVPRDALRALLNPAQTSCASLLDPKLRNQLSTRSISFAIVFANIYQIKVNPPTIKFLFLRRTG